MHLLQTNNQCDEKIAMSDVKLDAEAMKWKEDGLGGNLDPSPSNASGTLTNTHETDFLPE